MAPECLLEKKYSTKSDSWAFGVTFWEILNQGSEPYPKFDNVQAASSVMYKDLRPDIPENCPFPLVDIMNRCFDRTAVKRPTFADILDGISAAEKELADNPFYS